MARQGALPLGPGCGRRHPWGAALQRQEGGRRPWGDGRGQAPVVVTASLRPSEPQSLPRGSQCGLCDALVQDA